MTVVNPSSFGRPLLARLPVPFPHVPLGRIPSPVEWQQSWGAALGFETLCLKREDLSGDGIGGHKVRALEWLLPAAGPAVVTVGGYGSSHAAALAAAVGRTGRTASVALFPQPWSGAVETMLAKTAESALVFLARSRSTLPAALLEAWRAARRVGAPTWIPAGGATPLGVLGSVNAGLEFAAQIGASGEARPDVLVVPLGSGGTAAGLVLGLALAGWQVPIYAVAVADRLVANSFTVRWLVWRTRRLLARHGLDIQVSRWPLHVSAAQLGRGYGHPTVAGARAAAAAERHGLALDPTYGAKSFAALGTLPRSFRRPCFWHTFDSRGPISPAESVPLVRQAREYSEALWPSPKSI